MSTEPNEAPGWLRVLKAVSLGLLALFYFGAGVNHFLNPEFYVNMMPPYIPLHEAMVFLSGVAEVILGIGVLIVEPVEEAFARSRADAVNVHGDDTHGAQYSLSAMQSWAAL